MRPVDSHRKGMPGAHRRTGDVLERARAEGRPLTVEEFKQVTAPPVPKEHAIQARFIQWVREARETIPELWNATAVPHSEASRAEAGKKWAEGVEPGYPDWLLDVARGGFFGLRLEFKRPGEHPSEKQKAWHQRLARAGYLVFPEVTRWEQGRHIVEHYLLLRPTLELLEELAERQRADP